MTTQNLGQVGDRNRAAGDAPTVRRRPAGAIGLVTAMLLALAGLTDGQEVRREVIIQGGGKVIIRGNAQGGRIVIQDGVVIQDIDLGDEDPAEKAAGTKPADEEGGADRFVEESSTAEALLERIKSLLADGDVATAADLVRKVVEIGPESVVKDSGQGVMKTLTELVLSWSAEVRAKYESALGPAADEALEAAREAGGRKALAEVVRGYPGTRASRQAQAEIWAMMIESGDLARASEQLRAYLADPQVTAAERRTAMFMLALASAGSGQAEAARTTLMALQALGGEVTVGGRKVDAGAEVRSWLAESEHGPVEWPQVGGGPDRLGMAAGERASGGPIVLHAEGGSELFASTGDHIPSRREALARREVTENVDVEHVAAVTPNALLAVSGTRLVAMDRLSGGVLWKLDLVPAGVPFDFVSWPSSGDGCVAVVRWTHPTQIRRTRGMIFYGRPTGLGNLGRSLVVVREDTGAELWAWDGRQVDPEADLWNAAGRAGRTATGAAVAPRPVPAADVDEEVLGQEDVLEPAGSPLVYGGRVFLGAIKSPQYGQPSDCYLMCFELRTGKVLWQRFIGSGSPAVLQNDGGSLSRLSPTTDGEAVFVESAVGTIAAMDLATGQTRWARKAPWPELRNAYETPQANWPNGLGDAPIVSLGRVLVSDIASPGLRCLDARTGAKVWSVPGFPGGQRLGVASGLLVVTCDSRVMAYDVATGEQKFAVRVDSEISGRGFLSEKSAYVPTQRGIVRVDLETKSAESVYRLRENARPATALVPFGRDLVSCHEDRVLLFGPVDDFFEGVQRGVAAHPEEPSWRRRLAELYRQKGDFALAEAELARGVALAAKLKGADQSRNEQMMAYQGLEQLYLDWGRSLDAAGQTAEAGAKFELAQKYVTQPEGRVAAWLAQAQHLEKAGQEAPAAALYRKVAGEEMAQRMFVATPTVGLERTVASQATTALERLRGDGGQAMESAGIRRADLPHLEVHSLAMLSWSMPSYAAPDATNALAPVVWARPDGLVAFGRDGEIRWRFTRPMPRDALRIASVQVHAGIVFEKQGTCLSAHRQRDGELLWQWRPEAQQVAADLDPIMGVNYSRQIQRRITQGNLTRIVSDFADPQDPWYSDFAVTASTIVLAVRDARVRNTLTMVGLNRSSGEAAWQLAWPGGARFLGLRTDGGNVVVAALTPQGGVSIRCFAADVGKPLWEQPLKDTASLQGTWLLEGGMVLAGGRDGSRMALEAATGRPKWSSAGAMGFWAEAQTVAADGRRVIYACKDGYVSLASATGAFQWQAKVPGLSGEEGSARLPERVVLTEELLIAPTPDGAMAVRVSDGALQWRLALPVRAATNTYSVVLSNDLVVVYDRHGKQGLLHLVDVRTGKLSGRLDVGEVASELVIRVETIPGGLSVQLGNEMVTVTPRAGRGTTEPAPPILSASRSF